MGFKFFAKPKPKPKPKPKQEPKPGPLNQEENFQKGKNYLYGMNGQGINCQGAFDIFNALAQGGHMPSKYHLANFYLDKNGFGVVVHNVGTAIDLFQELAECGDCNSQIRLGYIYAGELAPDSGLAVDYYMQALGDESFVSSSLDQDNIKQINGYIEENCQEQVKPAH